MFLFVCFVCVLTVFDVVNTICLTQGSIEAELDVVQANRNLGRAGDGELVGERLLARAVKDAAIVGSHLQLEVGVGVAVPGTDNRGVDISVVDNVTGDIDTLKAIVRPSGSVLGQVVVSAEANKDIRHLVSQAKAEGGGLNSHLVDLDVGVGTYGDVTVPGANRDLGRLEAVGINLAGHGSDRRDVLEGQVSLVRVVALELHLEAGGDANERGLDGSLGSVGNLKLLHGEARGVVVFDSQLGDESAVAAALAVLVLLKGGGAGKGLCFNRIVKKIQMINFVLMPTGEECGFNCNLSKIILNKKHILTVP